MPPGRSIGLVVSRSVVTPCFALSWVRRSVAWQDIVQSSMKVFRVTVREGKEIDVILETVGIPRRLNRHQIEFWFVTFIRICREIAKLRLTPNHVSFVHRRSLTSEMNNFFSCDID